MKNKKKVLLVIVCVLLLSAVGVYAHMQGGIVLTPNKAHFVYFGLADRDTEKQIVTIEEGMAVVKEELVKIKTGGTVLQTWGCFVNEQGQTVENDTVLVMLCGNDEKIKEFSNNVSERLHLKSTYIEQYDMAYHLTGAVMQK